MTGSGQYFRAHILQTTAKRVPFLPGFLRQAKISNFDVPLDIQKHIFRFEIPIDNPLLMQILYSKQNLNKIFFGLLLFKTDDSPLQIKQLSTGAVLKNHDIVLLSFYELFHVSEEGECNAIVNLSLVLDELDFIFYFLFFYEFCTEEGAIHSVSGQVHFTESSHSYTFQHTI